MGSFRIGADTEDFKSFLLQNLEVIPQVTGFCSATRSIIFRIEIQDEFTSPEIFEA